MSADDVRAVREQLSTYDGPTLAALLRRRDVMTVPWPSDLDDLARRLAAADSRTDAYLQLSRPCVEVLSAVRLCEEIGERPSVTAVARWLGADESVVTQVVGQLEKPMLAWSAVTSKGIVEIVTGGAFPIDGRALGTAVRDQLEFATLAVMRPMCRRLGLVEDGLRPDVIARLQEFFDTPSAVTELLASAPEATRLLIDAAAQMDAVMQRNNAPSAVVWPGSWAVDRGLAWRLTSGVVVLSLPVTLAVLGAEWTLPFHPAAPEVEVRPASRDHVESEAATRLLRMVDLVSSVVDGVRTTPITLVRSRSVGARTVQGFAKDLHAAKDEIEMAVQLAEQEGLLRVDAPPHTRGHKKPPSTMVVSESAVDWQGADSPIRAATLLDAWWNSLHSMLAEFTDIKVAQGKFAVHLRRPCVGIHLDLPSGQGFAGQQDVVRMLGWSAPMLVPHQWKDMVALTLREAELLGVVALGAGTSLAAGLRDGDVMSAAAEIMSSAHTKATIGADLTAVVFGPPDIELARFFDSAADRESIGAATTWRFGPSSIRRAFDDGSTVQQVLSQLEKYSASDVPQALTYLINDVARTHGSLGVVRLGCAVIADDEALIAEVAANRRLAKLGARVLSPTVLGFTNEVDAVMSALREAGYAPVQRDSDGQVTIAANTEVAELVSYGLPAEIDFDKQAEFLLEAKTLVGSDPYTLAQRVMSESHAISKFRFAAGGYAAIAYRNREFTVHSARLRGSVVEVWNVDDNRYETLTPSAVRVVG